MNPDNKRMQSGQQISERFAGRCGGVFNYNYPRVKFKRAGNFTIPKIYVI
jgi:hypothetical protein